MAQSPSNRFKLRELLSWKGESGCWLVAHPWLDIISQGNTKTQTMASFLETVALLALHAVDENGHVQFRVAPLGTALCWKKLSEDCKAIPEDVCPNCYDTTTKRCIGCRQCKETGRADGRKPAQVAPVGDQVGWIAEWTVEDFEEEVKKNHNVTVPAGVREELIKLLTEIYSKHSEANRQLSAAWNVKEAERREHRNAMQAWADDFAVNRPTNPVKRDRDLWEACTQKFSMRVPLVAPNEEKPEPWVRRAAEAADKQAADKDRAAAQVKDKAPSLNSDESNESSPLQRKKKIKLSRSTIEEFLPPDDQLEELNYTGRAAEMARLSKSAEAAGYKETAAELRGMSRAFRDVHEEQEKNVAKVQHSFAGCAPTPIPGETAAAARARGCVVQPCIKDDAVVLFVVDFRPRRRAWRVIWSTDFADGVGSEESREEFRKEARRVLLITGELQATKFTWNDAIDACQAKLKEIAGRTGDVVEKSAVEGLESLRESFRANAFDLNNWPPEALERLTQANNQAYADGMREGYEAAVEAAARVAEEDEDKDEWSPRDIAKAIRALAPFAEVKTPESDADWEDYFGVVVFGDSWSVISPGRKTKKEAEADKKMLCLALSSEVERAPDLALASETVAAMLGEPLSPLEHTCEAPHRRESAENVYYDFRCQGCIALRIQLEGPILRVGEGPAFSLRSALQQIADTANERGSILSGEVYAIIANHMLGFKVKGTPKG